jgi:pimeloyl-ACP methyl ester carboxylesterase
MKPFKLIADYLTRRGIAVLRLDDRGVGGSNGDLSTATIADMASDISAAIDALRERDDINPDQIGVLGHSEGGDVAALLGATDPHVAFIVSMAGPAVRGYDLLVTQNQRLQQLQGQTEEQVAHYTEVYRAFLDAVTGTDPAALEPALYNLVLLQLQNLPADQTATLGNLEDAARRLTTQQLPTMQGAVMRDLVNYDPGPDWSKTTVPVLGLYGGKDVQVDAVQNGAALDAALKAAGNTDYQIVTFPTGNHLFQDAQTGGVEEYGTLPQEFLSDFLPTIGDWILARVTVPA